MSLVSYSIPNLAQGVSQQPDAQRDPSQGEIQVNGMSSIVEGLRKRDPSETLALVSATDFGDCFIHEILRDNVEEYLAVITSSSIKVFDLDGNSYDVDAETGAYNYLSTVTDPKAQIRAVTIADYTFITNTLKKPAMMTGANDFAPAVSRPKDHEALVWIKAATYGQKYVLQIGTTKVEVSTAVAPVVVDSTAPGGVRENRISSEEIADKLMNGMMLGSINTTPNTSTTDYLTNESPSGVTQSTTTSNTVTTSDGKGTGLKLNLTMDGSALTGIVVSGSADHGTSYAIDDKIYVPKSVLDGGSDATPVHIATVKKVDHATDGTTGGVSGIDSITRGGSVLWVQSGSAITISAVDARANADITVILSKVQAFTELPTIAPNNYQVTIEGDPTNSFDDYHVSFTPKNLGSNPDDTSVFGEGTWSETVKPGEAYKIDKDTMPHLLVRKPDDKFYFGPANGSQHTQGTAPNYDWTLDIPKWGERIAGDTTTTPNPSFIDNPINDIFIYKNRLGFLADENVILSRVRSFFEFFPETVTAVLDTDPIDVIASNNRVSVLKYAVPYQDELILFSSQYQFRFNAAETVLTPATAQITVLTQFEIDTNVRPQLAGGGIIFTQANGDFSQFREFSVRGAGTALTADAQDLTGYVSAFVPSSIHKLTVNDTSNAVFGISNKTGFKNRIYVYKYFVRNTGNNVERAQSSWSYWDLPGADEILQVLCVRETLFTLVRYGTDIYLEKIPVQDRSPEPPTGSPYPLLLDRRISTETETPTAMRVASGTYDADKNTTTWNLPYAISSTVQAWSGFSSSSTGGVLLATGNVSNPVGRVTGASLLYTNSPMTVSSITDVVTTTDGSGSGFKFKTITKQSSSDYVASFELYDDSDIAKQGTGYAVGDIIKVRHDYLHGGGSTTTFYSLVTVTATDATSIAASGDWRNKPIYFGEPYEFRYRFTRFKLYKEIGGGKAAANIERAQVRHAKLRYHETAFFEIEVTAERRDTATYRFDGTVLGVRESLVTSTLPSGGYNSDDDRYKEGIFNIPIMSKGERCIVEIKNDTPHPCKFSTCEWVALVTRRASALR